MGNPVTHRAISLVCAGACGVRHVTRFLIANSGLHDPGLATVPEPFDAPTRLPNVDLHMRLAMMLAGRGFAEVRALIDRGVASDGTYPRGTAYLLLTTDKARDSRVLLYPMAESAGAGLIKIEMLKQNSLTDRNDVMFYFIGLSSVAGLETLRFPAGAIADHLTSFGGMLTDSSQMSALRWLEAGATGSFGTVVEPCNFPQKFPDPAILIRRYVGGETLIEAYWKSVAWPGQGVFIGEPLAAPYRRADSGGNDRR